MEVELTNIGSPGPADIPAEFARRELLAEALGHLDPSHRAVVALHYLLGMPLREVAITLGIPVGTAKSRLHYALATMRSGMHVDGEGSLAPIAGGQLA
jgi:RNA polymerase sigma-70 factor, ECF subfamily